MSDDHDDCEVDRVDLSMHWSKDTHNDRWPDGGRPVQLVEQGGNAVPVFEPRG